MGLIKERIEQKLRDALSPMYLKVVNQSIDHKGHSGDDGSGESHFFVEISSDKLNKHSRINAQRLIYDILSDEMKVVHALSIKIK